MSSLLVLNGAVEPDGFSADLTAAYMQHASTFTRVTRIDLRELQFDPLLRRAHKTMPLEPDLARASQAILDAKHVTWIFPMWWSGAPALVKGFIDRVFVSGFAFRYRGRNQTAEQLLRGRSARLISSMDSPGFWYHLVQGRPLHKSFARGTLGFCGFAPVQTTFFYEARFMNARGREKAMARITQDASKDADRVLRAVKALPRDNGDEEHVAT
jgi:putative NADPH-quinone reductase